MSRRVEHYTTEGLDSVETWDEKTGLYQRLAGDGATVVSRRALTTEELAALTTEPPPVSPPPAGDLAAAVAHLAVTAGLDKQLAAAIPSLATALEEAATKPLPPSQNPII